MNPTSLETEIDRIAAEARPDPAEGRRAVEALLDALERGDVRAAEPDHAGGWCVHAWVKRGILLGFRLGDNVGSGAGALRFRDRDTFPLWDPAESGRDVRIVPGGSAVRRGAFLGDGVVLMPPAYVNVGAHVGAGTMIDSHALVGSCAQVGRNVHVSAAAQLGGVLEPVGAAPVIVEDDVLVGGGCGIYEGTRVGARAVLAPGTVLSRSVPLYDLVHEREIRAEDGRPLFVPAGAVVVPGARAARGSFATRHGLSLQCPVIVKFRDASTDSATALEDALR